MSRGRSSFGKAPTDMMIRDPLRMNRIAVVIAGLAVAGCTAPRPPLVVTDPDPSVKIPAIKVAVERQDLSAARQLVVDLESDDPAVRFYAISGLHRLTGENFGYVYYENEDARKPAVKRWQEWLERAELDGQTSTAGAPDHPAAQPAK